MLKDYLFTDNLTGEQFFVETTDEAHAWNIVSEEFGNQYAFDNLELECAVSPEIAEIMGLDTF